MSVPTGICTASAAGHTQPVTPTITPPIWMNDDCHTQNVLTCSICCDISLDPVVTPCHHIFCRSCIRQSLRRNKFCPNDRAPLRAEQLKSLNGPIKRVWSQTPVKCPKCQIWTGSLQSYCTEHGPSCVNPQTRIKELEGKLKDAEVLLRTKTEQMQGQIQELEAQLKVALQSSSAENSHDSSKRYYSSITGPFGPFGTQAQEPTVAQLPDHQREKKVTFGQSSTIPFPPYSFGRDNTTTPTAVQNHSNVAATASVTPTFSLADVIHYQDGRHRGDRYRQPRRIIRARRPIPLNESI